LEARSSGVFFSLMSMTMAMTNVTEKKSVLVVDDSDQICRMMKRRLTPFFEKVFTAADPKEATRILEEHEVTHVLCDFDLGTGVGEGDATGYLFVTLWRREFSNIERAVIFTGADPGRLARPEEVDAVVCKADGPEAAVEALLFEDRESPK
jgi:CheY-like chemotaxis protein